MRVLVVGASGFVGRHVLAHALAAGYEAMGTQARTGRPGLITLDLQRDRVWDRVDAAFSGNDGRAVAVICAAMSQIDRCFVEREVSRTINVDGTLHLVQDLRARGVKPVFLSSSFVYDGELGYYAEEQPPCPLSEYGRHKVEVERALANGAGDALVLRLDKVVGDDPNEDHLFSEWYRWARAGRPITCVQGQVLSPTYVGDIARGILGACEQGLRGVYHLANCEFFARDELARQFLAALGLDGRVECRPQAAFGFADLRPRKSYLDSTRFVRATGVRFTSMREVFVAFRQKLRSVASAVSGVSRPAGGAWP